MPIKIPNNLPATKTLNEENIFVMTEKRAMTQDIRSLDLLILNLMPTKIETETQILRLIGNSPLQANVEFLHMKSHESKNTSRDHLISFYKTFDEIKDRKFDGLIITGAPVENMEFEEVGYWKELEIILDWSKTNVFSTFHICWGAQAGLYHHYGIKKHKLNKKMFGIFKHEVKDRNSKLFRGFDEEFYVPHSRHTSIDPKLIENHKDLSILSSSTEAGVYIVSARNGREIYVMGHSEYDRDSLKKEYERDKNQGLDIEVPYNYFPSDDDTKEPKVTWRSHANLLYVNWLNYFVYQITPYDIDKI